MSNRLGRPPLDPTDRSVVVTLTLTSRTRDRIARRAALERVSVPEIIRRDLANSATKNSEISRG
jgi:hypothetical protein